MMEDLIDNIYYKQKFSWKKFVQSFFPPIIIGVFIFILIWIINYFDPLGESILLSSIITFFENNWFFFILFILIFSVWDYINNVFKNSLRFVAPLINSISIMFAFWIIGLIFNGLKLFLEQDHFANVFLSFLHDLVYQQTLILFVLILLINYSKFFLKDYKE
jgi:hypothetical protein